MDTFYYILDGKKPVACDDIVTFGKWIGDISNKRIQYTLIGNDINISTVFLGIDHSFNRETPVLFETLIRGGKFDQDMDRYETYDNAEKNHFVLLKKTIRKEKIERKEILSKDICKVCIRRNPVRSGINGKK